MKKLCIFCGARPNFIKVAPIIRVIDRLSEGNNPHQVSYSLVYAGSETDPTLEDQLVQVLTFYTKINIWLTNRKILKELVLK